MELYLNKYKRRKKMLEKALKIIEKIQQNEYLTAAEAYFVAELHDLLDHVESEFGCFED